MVPKEEETGIVKEVAETMTEVLEITEATLGIEVVPIILEEMITVIGEDMTEEVMAQMDTAMKNHTGREEDNGSLIYLAFRDLC